jgi:hypothetical protein
VPTQPLAGDAVAGNDSATPRTRKQTAARHRFFFTGLYRELYLESFLFSLGKAM